MKFLIDNNLSVRLPHLLNGHGHDAVHVRDVGLSAATDAAVLVYAAAHQRIVISADRDFGTLLAELKAQQPSVVYLRGRLPRLPEPLAALLDRNLARLEAALIEGRIVVIEPGRLRIRQLPLE